MVNDAYLVYMQSIRDESTLADTEQDLQSDESVSELVLPEDGGEEIEPSHVVGERQLQKYIDAVHKKLGINKRQLYEQ